jgi:hypothetical protein
MGNPYSPFLEIWFHAAANSLNSEDIANHAATSAGYSGLGW